MFSYFGGKSKLVKYYSPPKFTTIIEPFAGSARYACEWGLDNDVWINDLYGEVVLIWRWLTQATVNDIESLPELSKGETLLDYQQLSAAEIAFLGFCVGRCRNYPGNVMTGWAARDGEIQRTKKRLLPLIGNISHWKVTQLNFNKVHVDCNATYFVDPPYQHRKCDYRVGTTSPAFYKQLGVYCRSRNGQVIVCENSDATWLNFSPMKDIMGQRRKSQEVVCELLNSPD